MIPDATTINEKERLAELRSRFSYAESYRKQYDERAIACYKLYVGYRDKAKVAGRSNLHIPRVYEQLDTLRARLVKSFASTRPYVDFIPQARPQSTLEQVHLDELKADIASALVDMQLEQNNWKELFYDYVTSLLIFPASIMGVGWKLDRRMVMRKVEVPRVIGLDPYGRPIVTTDIQVIETPEIAWDDNELVNIDYFDFWPDPRGRDIDSCRFVFHREWMTREQIEERLEVLYQAGAGEVFAPDWSEIENATAGLEEGRWERLSSVGLTPTTSDGYWPKEGTGQLYEVLNYWEDEIYSLMVNRTALVYEGKNPYWRHSKKPFSVATFERLPNEFYGMSAVQLVEHLQHEINTHRNQRVDNVSLVLNRMWKVRRGADIDESELVSKPHGIIYMDNPDDVVAFDMPDVTASSYNEEQIAKMDMENTLGVPSVVRGVDSQRKETATEIVTKSTNAGLRFDVKIMLLESMGFKRIAYLMDCNNQQFIDTPRLVRLFGDEGDWRLVQPGELIGEFDYRPAGANIDPAANKEIRREQLGRLMAMVMQTQNPYVDLYELTRMWVQSFDLRNPDKVLKSPEQIQQEQEQQMMQEQAMQQAQAMPQSPQPGMQLPPELIQQLLIQGGGGP